MLGSFTDETLLRLCAWLLVGLLKLRPVAFGFGGLNIPGCTAFMGDGELPDSSLIFLLAEAWAVASVNLG